MNEQKSNADFLAKVNALVEAWCDRRELDALRVILSGWPVGMGLTDDWARLAYALHSLAGMRHLPEAERETAKRLWVEVDLALREQR